MSPIKPSNTGLDDDGRLFIDNSTLKAEARCSTEVMLRYGWGYTTMDEKAALNAGTAFHLAMEAHFKGEGRDAAIAAFSASYAAFSDEHVQDTDRLAHANLVRIVAQWLDTHPLSALPFTVDPTLVEVGFAYPLTDDGSIVFCGRLDGVAAYAGALYILEHKSTWQINAKWLGQYTLDSQLSGYLWAARQHTGKPVVGAFLNAVEFSRLPSDPSRKCKGSPERGIPTHGVPYSECGHLHANFKMPVVERNEDQLEEWRKTAIHLATRYRDRLARFPTLASLHKVRMQGTFNGGCQLCGFKDFCQMGRPPAYIEAGNLIESVWSPYDRSTGTAAT